MNRSSFKRLIPIFKIAIAVALVAALYRSADWRSVGRTLAGLDPALLGLALAMFVPLTLASAWRWRWLVRPIAAISFSDAVRHTLAGSALNLIVPSKLGDLSKAAMLPRVDAPRKARAAGRVVAEKVADVAALAMLLIWGSFDDWRWPATAALAAVCLAAWSLRLLLDRRFTLALDLSASLGLLSLAIWFLHLVQIDLFLQAAGVRVTWETATGRVPLAIFAGLLPISFCGIGTRDAALVWLFNDVAPASTMAGVGALTALRYLVPGMAGIPFVGRCLAPIGPVEPVLVKDQPWKPAIVQAAAASPSDPLRAIRKPDRPAPSLRPERSAAA